MSDAGRRRFPAAAADTRGLARCALAMVAAGQLAAVARLLWQALPANGTDPLAPWWAAAGVALLLLSASRWRAAWHAAACRYVGLAAVAHADPARAGDVAVLVAVPGQGRVQARVTGYWRLGDALMVLRLSDSPGQAPSLLLVPAGRGRPLQRMLHRQAGARG